MSDPTKFRKRADGPEAAARIRTEAAGLDWLRDAGGVPVPEILAIEDGALVLPWLEPGEATPEAAWGFGRELAATHDAGAETFGELPPGAAPVDGHTWIGLAALPCGVAETWGEFYARFRVMPYVRSLLADGTFGDSHEALFRRTCDHLMEGNTRLCGAPEQPARIHGDLWSGNVMWSTGPDGTSRTRARSHGDADPVRGWLIDPSAHGGHRETDLAMLRLFGMPHMSEVVAGYGSARPLPPGWRSRVPVHQLHPLLVHAHIFGGHYVDAAITTARAALTLARE